MTEETEVEPLLKYERVGGHFQAIFKDDSLSCIALHVDFCCVGTYKGSVLLLELDGRFLRRLHQHYKKVNHVYIDETGKHIASCSDDGTVASISLAPAAETPSALRPHASSPAQPPDAVSSRSSHLSSGGEVNVYNYFSAIYSVQLEDEYAVKRERNFCCGGVSGQLMLNRRGWIIDRETTLHEGEGPIQSIAWKNGLLAWANDFGVKVYDTVREQRVTYLEKPPNCPPIELCRCHLVWHKPGVLLIGWAHTLRVVTFSSVDTPVSPTTLDTPQDFSSSESSSIKAEIGALLSFDFFLSGLSPWGDHAVCLLAFRPPGSTSVNSSRDQRQVEGEGESAEMPLPEVHVVGLDGKQLAADLLRLKGYQRLRASDYKMPSLQYLPDSALSNYTRLEESGIGRLAYLCTPKDVVLCRTRDVDDRVQYALDRQDFSQALDLALRDPSSLHSTSLQDLMEKYIADLIGSKHFQKAADEIKRLLVGDEYGEMWEKYVYVFSQKNQLGAIARQIPTASPRLPVAVYEMVLSHFLDADPSTLLDLIQKWPTPRAQDETQVVRTEYTDGQTHVFEPLYDPAKWIDKLQLSIRRRRTSEATSPSMETSCLLEALAELYAATDQPDQALRIYLSQGPLCTQKDKAFRLISEHQLWTLVKHKVPSLLQLDRHAAIRMLSNQTEQLPIRDVVQQLEDDLEAMHLYLHQVFLHHFKMYNTEVHAPLHARQVQLYAQFDPDNLLHFLQTSTVVPLQEAYDLCSKQEPPQWEAMIYILGRLGEKKKAVDLILTQKQDIQQAIQFVQDHDPSLWDYLLDASLTNKDNVHVLFQFALEHQIDPIQLLKKLPSNIEIDDLKTKLLDLLSNYRIQQHLCDGATKVLQHDRNDLLRKQVQRNRRARHVQARAVCCLCLEPLKPTAPSGSQVAHASHAAVFECGHTYHLSCLSERLRMWKKAEVVDMGDLSAVEKSLGCFVCDHSTRTFAEGGSYDAAALLDSAMVPRGVSQEQLQRAKDHLSLPV